MAICSKCGREFVPPVISKTPDLCLWCSREAATPFGNAATPFGNATAIPETAMQPQGVPAVTSGLIAVNVLVWVLMVASGISWISPDAEHALRWGANFGLSTLGGQWWRLLTSMFIHFGILHLGLNMWCLWSLGRMGEPLMGRGPFLLLYLLSGLGGSLLSLAVHPMLISAGASGAIFGLAGGLAALFFLGKVSAPAAALKKASSGIGLFILYNLGYGLTRPNIDNMAHLGGLAVGLALGACFRRATQTEPLRPPAFPAVLGFVLAIPLAAGVVQKVQGPVVKLAAGEKLLDAGQIDQAIKTLKEVTASKPDLAAAYYLLGNAYLKKSSNDEAIAAYQRAVALDSENLNFRLNLGVAYLRKGEGGQAVPIFENILSREPQNDKAQLDLGIAYYQRGITESASGTGNAAGDYDKALAALQKALSADPNKAKVYALMAEVYLAKNDPGRAIANDQKALALDPKDSIAQHGICNAYRQNKSWGEAESCYEKLLVKNP